jgi:hypothetical protein
MEQLYATYQYYDEQGRRLAVFCRFLSPTEAEIFTLTCSKEDVFVKAYARAVYERYLKGEDMGRNKPRIDLVTIYPEQGELQTLLRFCKKNYFFYVTSIETALIETEILVQASEVEPY